MNNLLDCPFCGGTDLYWPHGTDPAIIECGGKNGCGARSGIPDDQTEAEAIAAWNRRATPTVLAADPAVKALVAEAKTEMVALFGISASRDTATGEPIMWGDAGGDCLTPEIALQERMKSLVAEAEARVWQQVRLRDQRIRELEARDGIILLRYEPYGETP